MSKLFLEKLLHHFNLDEEQYKSLTAPLSTLSIPSLPITDDIERAIKRINLAIANKEKILLYGDYDVDGIASTSIAYNALKEMGAVVKAYLPSRYEDGYGLNANHIDNIAKSGYKLIITLDNGVSAFEAINKAYAQGMEVIILDHHEIGEELPQNAGIIHHALFNYGPYPISAGFTAYLFFSHLLGHSDPFYLSLGGLSTLSDLMPLRGYNRDILRLALEAINEHHYPSFFLLNDKPTISYTDLSFGIIPTFNSLGRLKGKKEMQLALRLFDKEEKEVPSIASTLRKYNEERKALTSYEAFKQLEFDENAPVIVAFSHSLEGINGIFANHLLSDYRKPIAVFSKSSAHEGVYVGSLRVPDDLDFHLFNELSNSNFPFVAFGGHAKAAGISIKMEDFGAFKKEFTFLALKSKKSAKAKSIDLNFDELTFENLEILESFAPFGKGFEEPSFRIPPLDSSELTYSKDGKYLSYRLNPKVDIFSFKLGEKDLPSSGLVTFEGHLTKNEFLGRVKVRLLVNEAF